MFTGSAWCISEILAWAGPVAEKAGFTGLVLACSRPGTAGPPLLRALDDAAARLLRAGQADRRMLVRVAVEVLLRAGLGGSEFTGPRRRCCRAHRAGP
jgi:hypothetical protein